MLVPPAARAADDAEMVYLKLHRATLAQNLSEMMLYATDEKRAELLGYAGNPVPLKLVSSMMPRVYTVRSLLLSPDGTRARLRATGTFTFMGSNAPSFGVIDLARENGEWRVSRFEWSGDKPPGFDAGVAQAPVPRKRGGPEAPPPQAVPAAASQPSGIAQMDSPTPRPTPAPPEKPATEIAAPERPVAPSAAEPSAQKPAPQPLRKTGPCVIKPVMSDEDLVNCGGSASR